MLKFKHEGFRSEAPAGKARRRFVPARARRNRRIDACAEWDNFLAAKAKSAKEIVSRLRNCQVEVLADRINVQAPDFESVFLELMKPTIEAMFEDFTGQRKKFFIKEGE